MKVGGGGGGEEEKARKDGSPVSRIVRVGRPAYGVI
jgi:hypothetical protein